MIYRISDLFTSLYPPVNAKNGNEIIHSRVNASLFSFWFRSVFFGPYGIFSGSSLPASVLIPVSPAFVTSLPAFHRHSLLQIFKPQSIPCFIILEMPPL